MERRISLKKNMVLNAGLAVTSMVFPIITFPYISRVLNPDGLGKVQFVTSVVAYFAMIAGMGIQTYATRECAKVRDDRESLSRIVHELLMVNAITMAVAYVALFTFVLLVPKAHGNELLYFIIGLGIFFDCMGAEWLYTAKELFTYKTLRTIVFHLLALIATFVFIRRSEDYLIYGMVLVLPSVGNGLLNMINMRKHIIMKNVGGYHPSVHVKAVLVFFALAAATKIYLNLDTVMLGFIKGDTEVGYYTAAIKIKTVLVAMVTSASAVLLPRTSSYVEKGNMAGLRYVITKTLHLAIILSSSAAAFFMIFADETIMILSGEAYMPAAMPMRIITPAVIFIALTDIMGLQLLVPLGSEKKVVASVVAGASMDLIVNLLLIPRYGASGAAIGTVAAEAMVFAVQLVMLYKLGYRLFREIRHWVIILALALSVISSVVVRVFVGGYILRFIIGGVVFFTVDAIMLLLLKDRMAVELLGIAKLQ